MKRGTLFIVSAPSGAGKTSLVTALLRQEPLKDTLKLVVTYTTRTPRLGDINGQDYHFIEEGDFVERTQSGFFWSGVPLTAPIMALLNPCWTIFCREVIDC